MMTVEKLMGLSQVALDAGADRCEWIESDRTLVVYIDGLLKGCGIRRCGEVTRMEMRIFRPTDRFLVYTRHGSSEICFGTARGAIISAVDSGNMELAFSIIVTQMAGRSPCEVIRTSIDSLVGRGALVYHPNWRRR